MTLPGVEDPIRGPWHYVDGRKSGSVHLVVTWCDVETLASVGGDNAGLRPSQHLGSDFRPRRNPPHAEVNLRQSCSNTLAEKIPMWLRGDMRKHVPASRTRSHPGQGARRFLVNKCPVMKITNTRDGRLKTMWSAVYSKSCRQVDRSAA
jgi:hypothetical protein